MTRKHLCIANAKAKAIRLSSEREHRPGITLINAEIKMMEINTVSAQLAFEAIRKLVEALEGWKETAGGPDVGTRESVKRIIRESALVLIRSRWHKIGKNPEKGGQYSLLLGQGRRIFGDLNECNEPENARFEVFDLDIWQRFIPVPAFGASSISTNEILMTYARCFSFA